jgi:glycosyltransferase involved in cell wall biosynthesis
VFAAPFVRASDGDIEGLGLVVGEAIACHCPVVVGDVPAVKDLIFDTEGGVVSPLDKTALAGAIIKILADSVAASELARRRRIVLERRLAWPAVADGYSQLLGAVARPSEHIAQ